jgi:hypothetical protein
MPMRRGSRSAQHLIDFGYDLEVGEFHFDRDRSSADAGAVTGALTIANGAVVSNTNGFITFGTGSVHHRDRQYGEVFRWRVRALAIRDRPTAPRSPWQNPTGVYRSCSCSGNDTSVMCC